MPLEMEVGNAKFLGTCCWLPPHQLLDETEGARLSSLLLTLAHDNRICWVIMPETVATLAKGGGRLANSVALLIKSTSGCLLYIFSVLSRRVHIFRLHFVQLTTP